MPTKRKKFDLSRLRLNPSNPYPERDQDFPKFLKKLEQFPKFLELRPIVYDDQDVEGGKFLILGGNKRYRGLIELGYDEVPSDWVKAASSLSDEEKHEFIVADNVGFGEWDFSTLLDGWGEEVAESWGILIDGMDEEGEGGENDYSKKIKAPTYEPSKIKPDISLLYDDSRMRELIDEVNGSDLPEDEKEFLRLAAHRHIVFNYENVAEYYAHSEKVVQGLFENSALVIIDFDKAIEMGYVQLSEEIASQFLDDTAE